MSVVAFRPAQSAPGPVQSTPSTPEPVDIAASLHAIRQAAGCLQGVRLGDAIQQVERRIHMLPVAEPRLAMDQKASADFHATAAMLRAAALLQVIVADMGPLVMGADNAAV